MLRLFRRMCNIARHKGKALGLIEQHEFQRHEDGSYTMTVQLIPERNPSDVGSVDRVIIHKSRGIVRHEAG